MIRLIRYKTLQKHVSHDTVSEFENKIVETSLVDNYLISNAEVFTNRLLTKIFFKKFGVNFSSIPKREVVNFCIMLGDEYHKAIWPFFTSNHNNAYFFDAWPSNHFFIEKFIRSFNLKNVFFSSKQVVDIFKQKNLNCKFHWVPEGIDTENYKFKEYEHKDIDVLAFGRKFNKLHDLIVDGLNSDNIIYLYEEKPGHIIFPTREEFLNGLSRSKISICIPSNITHPERSGKISTMTVRYLQSMASKCLILGFMPEDMKDLFPYMPIINLDICNPLAQIKDIIKNYASYQELIEKNYNYTKENHSWLNRWLVIKKILDH